LKPIKVVHITTIDGSLRYLLLNQLQSIQEAGYEVSAISAPGSHVPEVEKAGIRHLAVPFVRSSSLKPFADLIAFWHLYQTMRRERFTIVHTHTAKPDLYGQMAARLAGVPVVMSTLHGFYFHEHMRPMWRRFYIALSKLSARFSDVILSQNSEDIKTAAVEKICLPERIKFLGNGIDVVRFNRERLDPAVLDQTRQGLGLEPGTPVVGFVGRLVRDKGLLELFEAAKLVLQQHPHAKFLIVGPDNREKSDALSPETARDYGVADACIFTGRRHDMPELYALMDVFVLPSHREAFPRAPMEASAMGVPCVVTNVRGCREAVEDGRNGCLVPLGDSRALAEAISGLLRDQERARQMGLAGRQIALERFDEQHVFAKVKSEYVRLLQVKGIEFA
jgi:glycosyltransferase involved in cell wall biosynthesis